MASIGLEQDELRAKQAKTEEKLIDLQWRGMRENLIFSGIDEPILARGEYENVELTLRNFLRMEMNITEQIPFDRVHRLGMYNREQSRPIIAKFERFRDKGYVRKQAPSTLVNNEHYPVEMENKRKLLYPEVKKARRNAENKVKFVKDRLYINGVEVVVEETENQSGQARGATASDNSESGRRVIYKQRPTIRNDSFQQHVGRGRYKARGRGSYTGAGRDTGNGWFTQQRSAWGMPPPPMNFQKPVRNRYAAISRYESETPRPIQTSGKHQASSPVDSDMNIKKHKECDEIGQRIHVTGNFQEQEPINIDPSDDLSGDDNVRDGTASGITPQTSSDTTGLKMHEGVNDSASLYYGPGNPPSSSATSQIEVTPHDVGLPTDTTARDVGDKNE